MLVVMGQGLAALLSSKAMRLTRSPALQSFDCMDSPVDTFMEHQYPGGPGTGSLGEEAPAGAPQCGVETSDLGPPPCHTNWET